MEEAVGCRHVDHLNVRMWIDPPSGWLYGFPKEYDWDPDQETQENWFIRNGYPAADVGLAIKYSRTGLYNALGQ